MNVSYKVASPGFSLFFVIAQGKLYFSRTDYLGLASSISCNC